MIKKIQIIIPGGGYIGGIESLHQLATIQKKIPTTVVYIPLNRKFKKNYNLKSYKINLDNKIDDEKNNLIIIPETFSGYARSIKNAKIALWWLSVDNYFRKRLEEKKIFFLLKQIFFTLMENTQVHYEKSLSVKEIKKKINYNLYQSNYAKKFCIRNKLKNIYFINDYINLKKKLTKVKKKKISYNGLKINKLGNNLIKKINDKNLFPLKNFTLSQTFKFIKESLLYCDFGHFPGRDRMPRESILCNTNILLNNTGSAADKIDFPIDEIFKFNLNDKSTILYLKIMFFLNKHCHLLINKKFKKFKKNLLLEKKYMTNRTNFFLKNL